MIGEQFDFGFESRVVAGFNFESRWKSEPIANVVEIVVAADEHDAVEGDLAAEIHLHPFAFVRRWFDSAVIAVLWRSNACRFFGGENLLVEFGKIFAAEFGEWSSAGGGGYWS